MEGQAGIGRANAFLAKAKVGQVKVPSFFEEVEDDEPGNTSHTTTAASWARSEEEEEEKLPGANSAQTFSIARFEDASPAKSADGMPSSRPKLQQSAWEVSQPQMGKVNARKSKKDPKADERRQRIQMAKMFDPWREYTKQRLLRSSYGIDKDLEKLLFAPNLTVDDATENFFNRFKDKSSVPSRVRVRIYLTRAVCIFRDWVVNPFLSYRIGQGVDVSMRNMAQFGVATPGFYRVEERDIQLPQEGRLQLNVNHLCEAALVGGDQLVGSTVVDLEDRWHSAKLSQAMVKKQVPIEHRPLVGPGGRSGGSVEMRIEMLDSVKAADEPPAQLPKPKRTELELRFVIRSATGVKIVDGDHTDVKVVVELECDEYNADQSLYPKVQATDIHWNSESGDAIFNWRAVFPRIAMPTTGCNVTFKVYDANNVVADAFIGEVCIDIRKHLKKVARDLDALVVEKGVLTFRDPSGDVESSDVGKVQFEMYVMTQAEATTKLAGLGRDEPNAYPMLAAPVDGRLWADVVVPYVFELPRFGFFGQIVLLILFALMCLVILNSLNLI
jgi:hypothetical protein